MLAERKARAVAAAETQAAAFLAAAMNRDCSRSFTESELKMKPRHLLEPFAWHGIRNAVMWQSKLSNLLLFTNMGLQQTSFVECVLNIEQAVQSADCFNKHYCSHLLGEEC